MNASIAIPFHSFFLLFTYAMWCLHHALWSHSFPCLFVTSPHPCIHPPPKKNEAKFKRRKGKDKTGGKWKFSSWKLQCETENEAVNPFVHVRSPFIIVAYTKQLPNYYSKYLFNITYIWICTQEYIHAQLSIDVLIRLLSVFSSVSHILPRPVPLTEFVSVSRKIFLVCHLR